MNGKRCHGPIATVLMVCVLAGGFTPMAVAQSDEQFERLFTTPRERLNLDRARATGVAIAEEQAQQERPAERVVMKGYVKRADKNNTVWINDSSTLSGDLQKSGIVVRKTTSPESGVPVVVSGRNVTLKPGQTFDLGSGETWDSYQIPKSADVKVEAAGEVGAPAAAGEMIDVP